MGGEGVDRGRERKGRVEEGGMGRRRERKRGGEDEGRKG